jgi:hypothetical protein
VSEDQPDDVRHSRRFVSRHPDRPDIHGVQFPSGRVIADDPRTGLVAALGPEHLDGDDGEGQATVIWAAEPAPEGVGESKSPA